MYQALIVLQMILKNKYFINQYTNCLQSVQSVLDNRIHSPFILWIYLTLIPSSYRNIVNEKNERTIHQIYTYMGIFMKYLQRIIVFDIVIEDKWYLIFV